MRRLVDDLVSWLVYRLACWQVDELAIPLVNSLTLKCHDFSVNFNIVSALFAHQSLILPQKIDSREGLFRCKKGLVVHADKMNFYLN